MFNPLEYHLCLEKPRRVTDILSWHEHIPFAFALIQMLRPKIFVELGTHKGDSYFAFCQAVDVLKLGTACYAVDTWKGDEHAGLYEEKVLAELKAYHESHYKAFSTLIRCSFDVALSHFADKSIDLLHIDGLHSYDAVKHDYDNWLPKMSEQGIVLLHDISVRERDFGVWRLWEELSSKYETVEFKYGHGLGIIPVGSTIPKPLKDLSLAMKENNGHISDFFYILGFRLSLLDTLALERKQLETKDNLISELNAQNAEHERKMHDLLHSWSWRMTAPLRSFFCFLTDKKTPHS